MLFCLDLFLYRFFDMGENMLEICFTVPRFVNILVKIKNGNRLGIRIVAQIVIALSVVLIYIWGLRIIAIKTNRTIKVKNIFFFM